MARPPPYAPGLPRPAYAHRPGQTPHPHTNPHGHRFSAPEPPLGENLAPGELPLLHRFAIGLYHEGFYWEAHEAWETLWRGAACEAERELYRGLIQCAAAALQSARGRARGVSLLVATLDLGALGAALERFADEGCAPSSRRPLIWLTWPPAAGTNGRTS